MNTELNNYITEYGENSIWDVEKLCEHLSRNNVDEKTIHYYALVLQYGDLKDILSRTEQKISSVMLNTAIINTVKNTGLRQSIVQDVLSDVFSALHVSYEGESLFGFNTENGTTFPIERQLSPDKTERKLRIAKNNMKNADKTSLAEAIRILNELAKSGNAEAMYLLGMIKKRELDSELNRIYNRVLTAEERKQEIGLIQKLFECAAANGNANAKAELGDVFYEQEDYDKAYEYYTAPGVISVKASTKERIISILNQRIKNTWLMILGGVLLLCIWIFMFLNLKSVHNNTTLFGWGIPINILVSLVYGYMCFSIQKRRYHNHKFFVFVMMVLWSIYPLILAIN